MTRKLRMIDLFAGCGGLTGGFIATERFEPAAAVERDVHAAATYAQNFGDHIHVGDIADWVAGSMPAVDVVVGGPPCQGFSALGRAVDFGEAAALAAALLETRDARPADHVLVDEGQDLNPTQWQFLRALVAEGADDLFIAEDSHQRIYGQRVVVGRYGIKIVGRSRRLALNYRTTAQNLHFAVGVLEGGNYLDIEEQATAVEGYRSARSGPAPRLVATSSITEELEQAAEIVSAWIAADVVPETIGILVRDAAQSNQVSRGL